MWDPCLACGEKNSVVTDFCGHCGDDLRQSVRARQRHLQDALSQADEKARSGRFLEALSLLESQEIVAHSKLVDLAGQVHDRLERFPRQREEAIAGARQVTGVVQELLKQNKYHAAYQQLQSVPAAFLNQELRAMLEQVQARVRESDTLRRQVKEKLRDRSYRDLLPQVKRLAALNPDEDQIQQLLGQLVARQAREDRGRASQLILQVKTALTHCDYKQARRMIDAVPEGIEDPNVQKAAMVVKEQIWMAELLPSAPYLSETLLAMAQRFMRQQSQDQRLVELIRQMEQRWARSAKVRKTRPILWAKPPEQTPLGVPVDLLPCPGELESGPGKSSLVGASHAVAFGLALQALGQAEFAINLVPQEDGSSWLRRIASRSSKRSGRAAWGIEIGSHGLKAVLLANKDSAADSTGRLVLKVLQSVFLPHRAAGVRDATDKLSDPGKDPSEGDRFPGSETVRRFLDKHDLTGRAVAINLPGTQTLGRFVDLPAAKPNRFHEAVRYEVRAKVPLSEEETLYDYHWTEAAAQDGSGPPLRRVLIAASQRKNVEGRLHAFAATGAGQLIVQSDCLALGNTAAHLQATARKGLSSQGAVAIAELGTMTTNFVVLRESQAWFRGIHLGANAWNLALARGYQQTHRQAEALRLQPEKWPHMHQIHACLLPEFATVTKTLRKTMDQYQRETGHSISRLYLCGGGSRQFGLLRYLRLGR